LIFVAVANEISAEELMNMLYMEVQSIKQQQGDMQAIFMMFFNYVAKQLDVREEEVISFVDDFINESDKELSLSNMSDSDKNTFKEIKKKTFLLFFMTAMEKKDAAQELFKDIQALTREYTQAKRSEKKLFIPSQSMDTKKLLS